jgi:hypothetical protein
METKIHTEVHTDDGRIDIELHNHVGGWSVIIENIRLRPTTRGGERWMSRLTGQ